MLRLRALPPEARVLPPGLPGQALGELLAGVEGLSDTEVLALHREHLGMYLNEVATGRTDLPLARLADIAADRRIDQRWRAGALMALSRYGEASASALPRLQSVLKEFPAGAYTAQDRDLLCATATALGKIGEASRPHLPSLLAIFEHPQVQADDRATCAFGGISIRSGLLEVMVAWAPDDERVIALCERCLLDADVSLQLAATAALPRSGAGGERCRAGLTHALHELQAQPAQVPDTIVSRADVIAALQQTLSGVRQPG